MEFKNNLNVVIISTIQLYKGRSAGSSRMMNYAKAFEMAGNDVFLFSLNDFSLSFIKKKHTPNIYYFESTYKLFNLFHLIDRIFLPIKTFLFVCFLGLYYQNKKQITRIIVYPSTKISLDFWAAIILKKIFRYKIFYEANEVRKYSLFNKIVTGNSVNTIAKKTYHKYLLYKYTLVEQFTIYYDGLFVITDQIRDYFFKYNQNALLIPILVSWKNQKPIHNIILENEKFIICFCGSIIVKKEGLDTLFESLSILKKKSINFELHLYGYIEEDEKDLILNYLPQKNNLNGEIKYFGVLEENRIINVLRDKNLLVLPRPKTLQNKYGFSTKLGDYLSSGVPTLVTNVSDNGKYIIDGENGFIVSPNDLNALVDKIVYIINNYNNFIEHISCNAIETAFKYFHYSKHSQALTKFLN